MTDTRLQNYITWLDKEGKTGANKANLIAIAKSIWKEQDDGLKVGFDLKSYWKKMLATVEKK